MPVVRKIRQALSCHVASLPVPYRTTDAEPTFQSLTDRSCACIPGNRPFPTALDPFTCNRYECAEYAREALDIGVRYIGLCCGAAPHHVRAVAEALGRRVPASRYSPDMSKHAFFGTDAAIPDKYKNARSRFDPGGFQPISDEFDCRRAALRKSLGGLESASLYLS